MTCFQPMAGSSWRQMRLMHRLVTMTSCWLVGYLDFWLIGWLPRFPVGTLVGYHNFRLLGYLTSGLLVG